MARLKKSLALLLAFVMMFSSMSVAASAWTVEEEEKGLSFSVKFFREKDGEWIETSKAAPGEAVKARVYLSTEFASFAGELAVMFDSDFLTPGSAYGEGTSVPLTTNKSYTGTDPKTGVSGTYGLTSTASWRHNESGWTRFAMDFIKENMLVDENGKKITDAAAQAAYFNNRDLIATTFGFDSGINNFYFDGSQWLMEYDLVVAAYPDAETQSTVGRTKTIDEVGTIQVPKFYDCLDWTDEIMFVDIYMGEPGAYRYSGYQPMYYWVPEMESAPATISTTSEMVFDANGGTFSADATDTTRTAKGIIGTEPTGVATPSRSGYTFRGWSYNATEPAEGAAGEAVVYDYDKITVYAVWEPSKTHYTYEKYEMLTDGTYPSEPTYTEEISADANANIPLPNIPVTGFTLDTAISTPSIIVAEDNSSVLKAYYARNKYNVNYHFEDGLGEQTDSVSSYYEAEVPAFAAGGTAGDPIKEGYNFVGWSTNPDKMATPPETMPASDLDLYPIYEIKSYTYYFDATVGGVFPASGNRTYTVIYKHGETPVAPEDPEKDGYTFVDWDMDIPATATSDMNFEALYNEAEYTVTFMDGEEELDSYIVLHGDEVLASDVPYGYKTENSWTLADNTVVNFPYAVTSDVTFYATDSANVYDANFYTYENEAEQTGKVLYDTIPTVFGETIEAPDEDPKKDGYTFIGWNPDPTDSVMEEDGFEAIAIFDPNTITITFDANEGTAVGNVEKEYGESIDELPTTDRTGYTFDGWYTEKLGGTKVSAPYAVPTKDTTLYAHWIPESHTVTYVDINDDQTESVITSVTKNTGEAIDAPKPPSKTGYTFAGWLNAETKEIEDAPTTMPVKDAKYIAQWEINNYSYTVDANGGKFKSGDETQSGTADHGTAIPLETPENTGNKLLGWSTDSDDKTVEIPATATEVTVTGNMTIKAVWEQELYTISFDAAGGKFSDGTSSYSTSLAYGAPITAPVITTEPDGFEFDGWLEVTEKIGVPDQMPNKNLSFVAQWKEKEIGAQDYTIYAVTYNPATGEQLAPMVVKTGSLDVGTTVEVVYNAADSQADVPLTYDSLYNSVSHEPDDEKNTNTLLTIAEGKNELTVYYKLKEFTATFNGNGGTLKVTNADGSEGTAATATATGTYGQVVTAPEIATAPEGHTFSKWEPSIENETYTSNKEYKALWTPNTYNAIFEIYNENGKLVDTIKVPYVYGTEITAPEYKVPDGYNFTSWNVPAGTEMGAGDMTFDDAVLAPIDYTLSYSISGAPEGVNAPASQTAHINDSVTVAKAPEVTGYTFDGWYDDNGNSYKADGKGTLNMPKGGIVLTGTYSPVTIDIYFNTGSSVVLDPNPVEAEYGKPVELPGEDKMDRGDDYKFIGWADATGNVIESPYTVDTTEDITLNAKWEYKVEYTVSGAPAGAPEAPEAKFYAQGASVAIDTTTPETITVDGATYTFSGWKINGKDAADFTMGTAPVEITGSWTKNEEPKEYTVSYAYTGTVPAGADDLLPEAHKAVEGTENVKLEAAPTTITVDGVTYTFSGWYHNGVIATEIAKMPANDVTVVGYWNAEPVEVKEYKLTLDPNGGTLNGSSEKFVGTYEEGTKIPPIATPVRDGYKFVCWKDADGSVATLPTEMPANDVTYTAEWDELYDVTYKTEDGKEYETITNAGVEGDAIPAPTKGNPSKDGYNFTGWVDAETGETVSTIPAGGVTLKPVFEEIIPDTYAVSYKYTNTELPKDVPALPLTTYKAENDAVTVAPVPVLEGYTFDGWKLNGTTTASFLMPAEAVVLEGTWVVKEHSITLNANGGVFTDKDGVTTSQFVDLVDYGTPLADVIPANPTKEGYTFDGWDVTIPETMPDKDIEATAKWKINEYTITFDSNGGSAVPSATYKFGADVTEPTAPTRDGFNFIGWSPALPETMPANDVTVVAQWEAKAETKTATLTMNANGGEFSNGDDEATKDFAVGEEIDVDSLEKPTKDGYTFTGWDGIPDDGIMPEGGLTITAKWEKNPDPTHTVTYYLAKGENVDPYDTKTFAEGAAIVHPANPEQTGATFVGWFDADGNEIPAVMGGEDLVAYAKFELNKYTATFKVDGEVYEEYELLYGEKLEAPEDPTNSDPNKLFVGWAPAVPSTMPAENMVFEAQWADKADDRYSVTFIADGKTCGGGVYKVGDIIEVPEDPEKFGFVFVGWEPAVPATMPAEDLVFEAQWEIDKDFVTVVIGGTVIAGGVIATIAGINATITGAAIVGGIITIIGVAELVKHTHTVTYIVDGEVYKTYKVVEGTKIPVPADPEKDGFMFEGWNPEVPEKMGETDLVFEATWSEKSDDADVNVPIPDTGSVAGGLTAFAIISGAAAAAYVITRKKKED